MLAAGDREIVLDMMKLIAGDLPQLRETWHLCACAFCKLNMRHEET